MQLLKQAVGIDISKDSLVCCFGQITLKQELHYLYEETFANTTEGFRKLLHWAQQLHHEPLDLFFLMEATGVYYENLAYFLKESEQKVIVMLPNQAKAFARSTSIKTKTDRVDARMLCRMVLERSLPLWQPPCGTMHHLKELSRERQNLISQITQISNQLSSLKSSYKPAASHRQRLKQQKKFLSKQVTQVESEIAEFLKHEKDLRQRIENVQTIKGVGLMTVVTVVAETNGFALVRTAKQLISYAGLDLVESQSGSKSSRAHISRKGNARIRGALYMPSLAAIRFNDEIKPFYQRICQRHPQSKLPAVVAVERKLLRLIYALWRTNKPYDPAIALAQ